MSSAIVSLVQGFVAGGSAIYLQNRLSNEVEKKGDDKWTTVALQVNHLLLLTAETIYFAGSPLGLFGLAVKAVWVATPLAIVADFYGKESSLFTKENTAAWNVLYKVGVAATSVATLALGNPVFAAVSLSMLAIDAYYADLSSVSKVAAVFGLVGYGAQAFAAKGAMAWMSAFTVATLGIKQLVTNMRTEAKPSVKSSKAQARVAKRERLALLKEQKKVAKLSMAQNRKKTVHVHHYHPEPSYFSNFCPTPTYYRSPQVAAKQKHVPIGKRQWTSLPKQSSDTDSSWNFFSRPSVYAPEPTSKQSSASTPSSDTTDSSWNFFTRASVWA